jgi:uncharacterized protein YndB with AHSA1/START domain
MTNTRRGAVIGSTTAQGATGTVRMESTFDTDITDLWDAVTTPERVARWMGEVSGDLRPGGTIHSSWTSTWEGSGRIDVCEAPNRLLLTMQPGDPEETVIEAVLTADGDRTKLVVEERGLPTEVLSAHGAGWQAHIEDLAAHIDGRERTPWEQRWNELIPHYSEIAAK